MASRIFLILLFVFVLLGSRSVLAELDLAQFAPENSPRLMKVRLPFDSARLEFGTELSGFLVSEEQRFSLQPLTKYQLRLNPLGEYDFSLLSKGKEKKITSLALPFTLQGQDLGSSVQLNGLWYRGEISFEGSVLGVIAINKLDSEHIVNSLVGSMSEYGDTVGAIKSAAVIVRSYLYCLGNAKEAASQYHFSASQYGYLGRKGEKGPVSRVIGDTDSEVLVLPSGELLCTPPRSALKGSALPFEMVGLQGQSWERIFKPDQLSDLLYARGSIVGRLESVSLDSASGLLVLVGDREQVALSLAEARDIFQLPSASFRVYSYQSAEGDLRVQVLGAMESRVGDLAGEAPTWNIVKFVSRSRLAEDDYRSILRFMFPRALLARL